jgi:hypothetical protein
LKALIKITIGVCLLLSSFSKGQTSLFFDKYYKTGYDNLYTSNVLFLEDSTYAVLSYVRDSITGQQNMSLLKIDKLGNEILKKTHNLGFDYLYYYNGLRQFTSISKTSIFSTAVTYTNSQATIIINKISKQTLDTIKSFNYYDGLYSYYAPNIIQINNNKFFLIGNKFNSTNYWPFIFEMDSNLVIKSSITCVNTQSLSTKIALYDNINKKLVLGGGIASSLLSFISIVDTLGAFSNTYINNSCSNITQKIIYSVFDNSYITIGFKKTSVYGSQTMVRPYVCKFNATNLNLIWQKTYGKSNMVNTLYNGVVNTDGSIVVVGRYSDSLNNPLTNLNCNAVMIKIRSNGDSLWMKEFDNLNNTSGPSNNWWEYFSGIDKTPEGGYITCGGPFQMPLPKAWIVKTDSMGCALASCMPASINEEMQNKSGNIYPNPASNIIYLNLPKSILNSDIEIINTLGTVVAKYPLSTEKINIEKLNSGTYFIKVQTQDYTPYYSKFIKE